jgi:hypothetical protein
MKALILGVALAALIAPAAFAKTETHHHHATIADLKAASAYHNAIPDPDAPVSQAAADGYHRATGYEQTKAACELFADSQPRPGFFVAGNQNFVGASTFAYGVGSLIRHARSYDQCMTLHGYVK